MLKRKYKTFVLDDGEYEDREEDSVAIINDNDDEDEGASKVNYSGSKKKMKINNLEAPNEIPIVWKDQDEENMVEDVLTDEEEDDEVEKSAEPKTGETSSNLVLKKLLRGARYYDPPDTAWVSCYSCGKQGHRTVNCPTPTKCRKPCFICGSLEHGAKQCSKGHDCYICNRGGHRAKDCPDKYTSGSKGAVCLRCGDFRHDMLLCNYVYSQEDLKGIQCYVCKSFGHLCCVEPGNSPSWAVSCYRCGQLGHTGLACGRHYGESNESVSPTCFKCGEEGHLKRECTNASPENTRHYGESNESVSPTCFKCGEEGHFKRECPNASPENTREVCACFGCGEKGHFKRECPNASPENTREVCACFGFGEKGHVSCDCPNSSSISTSRGIESPSLSYKRKRAGYCKWPKPSQDKLDVSLTRNSHLMQCIDQLLSQ